MLLACASVPAVTAAIHAAHWGAKYARTEERWYALRGHAVMWLFDSIVLVLCVALVWKVLH